MIIGVIEHTNPLLFLFMLFSYGLCMVAMGFMVASVLKSTKTMFIVAVILLILVSLVYYVVELLLIRLGAPYIVVMISMLLPPVPYGHLVIHATISHPVLPV